jgi:dephospho-CoA kinase
MGRQQTSPEQPCRLIKIGVTGGVGSGKSLVCRRLQESGVPVVSADQLARQAVEPHTRAHKQIVERFGKEILAADGTIDRPRLRQIITQDEIARRDLESYVHPEVGVQMQAHFRSAAAQGAWLAAAEVPLLFEAGLQDQFDAVILVSGDTGVRINRIMQRDNVSRQQAQSLMHIQMDEAQKRRMSDFIIENNGSIDQMHGQVDRVLEKLAEKYKKTGENG